MAESMVENWDCSKVVYLAQWRAVVMVEMSVVSLVDSMVGNLEMKSVVEMAVP